MMGYAVATVDQLPGGAVAILKKARDAGGWRCWATYARGQRHPGQPLVESVLVKGTRKPDPQSDREGCGFVVEYLRDANLVPNTQPWTVSDPGPWKIMCAYLIVVADGQPYPEPVSVTDLKKIIGDTLRVE